MQFTMKMVIGKIRDKTPDISLVPGQSLVIGRSNVADYLIRDSAVSSRHASLVCDAEAVLLTDLGSRNGTFVNESKIKQIALSDEDKVRIGTCVFRVSIADGRSRLKKEGTDRSEGGFAAAESSLAMQDPGTEVQPMKLNTKDEFVSEGSIPFGEFPKSDSGPVIEREEIAAARNRSPLRMDSEDVRKSLSHSERNRVVINVIPPEGEKDRIVLNSGQDVSFGNSGLADFEIKDSNLDDLHFRICLVDNKAVLTDNQSLYGTFLNGQQITRAELSDGDKVEAGRTKFKFLMAGDAENQPTDSTQAEPIREIVPFSAPAEVASTKQRDVDKKTFDSGLVMLGQETVEQEEIEEIVAELLKTGQHFVIIDFVRISKPLPEGLNTESSMLFDWIPEAAAIQSPQLVAMEQLEDWKEIFASGWGCDGLILLGSDSSFEQMIEKLREMVRGPNRKGNVGGSITGVCWPSVLANVLKNDVDDIASSFSSELRHVFLETMGGGGWELFAQEKHADRVARKTGMRVIEPEPEADETNDGLTTESD